MLAAWPCTASCFRIAVVILVLLILVVVLVLLLLMLVLPLAVMLVVERLGRRLCACSIVAVMVWVVLPVLLPRVPD